MFRSLELYKKGNGGSIEIPENMSADGAEVAKRLEKLRRWCESQLHHQRRCSMGHDGSGNLTDEKIEKLREIGFRLAPTYDEMYDTLAARCGADAGAPPDVDEGEDGELHAWVEEQKKFLADHSKGKPVPLSNDRILKLTSLGYSVGRDEKASDGADASTKLDDGADASTKWDAMFLAVKNHKEERGTLHFPSDSKSLPKSEKMMKNWIGHQRSEYRKLQKGETSKLTAQRLQLLHSIGLELTPRFVAVSWAERMKSLREFVEEHGHCKPKRDHPLASFVSNVRHFYTEKQEGRKSCLTDERIVSSNPLPDVDFINLYLI